MKTTTMRIKPSFRSGVKKYKLLLLFPLPMILLTLVFSYLPMIGVLIGFKQDVNFFVYSFGENLFGNLGFNGWTTEHFMHLFSDSEFLPVLRNTLVISILKLVLYFPVPIILAILLTEIKAKHYSKFVQSMVFLPHFLSWAIIIGIFTTMFDPISGIFNVISVKLGGSTIDYLGSPKTFYPMVIISSIWKESGWGSIVFIAAISAIDPTYYEAAKIDGAGKMKQIWKITLPSIAPTIAILFILRLGGILDAGFEQIFMMKTPATQSIGEILGTYVYNMGLTGTRPNYPYATAVGLFNSIVSMALVLGGNLFVKKVFKYSIW